KTRIIAHQQQMVRVDHETSKPVSTRIRNRLLREIEKRLDSVDGIIIGDYGKGVIAQELLDKVKSLSAARDLWLSLDPKPTNSLNLQGLSLITPNRKEAFELAGISDDNRH